MNVKIRTLGGKFRWCRVAKFGETNLGVGMERRPRERLLVSHWEEVTHVLARGQFLVFWEA